jgi:glycosyltransferase involved in cell wall biosynthesis
MRIGINARLLIQNKLEGIGWHAWELIQRVIALRPDDTWILYYDRLEEILVPQGKRIEIQIIKPISRHPILFHAWAWNLSRAWIRDKIDIFYSPEPIWIYGTTIPAIITVHDLSPIKLPKHLSWSHRWYYDTLLARVMNGPDQIITVSQFSKNEIQNTFGIPDHRIEIISNAVRSIFQPIESTVQPEVLDNMLKGKPYFLHLGSLNRRKQVDRVIKGFDQFKLRYGTSHVLILAGSRMGNQKSLNRALRSSRYQHEIFELGYQPDREMAGLLAKAEGLINLSAYEGFGMPLIEAFQAAVPVVANDIPSYREVGNGAALLVNAQNPAAIADAMKDCIDRKTELIRLGRERVLAFDWDRSAAKLAALLDSYRPK